LKSIKFVLVSLVVVALCYIYSPDYRALEFSELELPVCSEFTERYQSQVSFFIAESLRKSVGSKEVDDAIQYSNLVLNNSCIPLQRTMTSMEYVQLDLSYEEDFESLHQVFENALSELPVKSDTSTYVLILPNQHRLFEGGTVGLTDVETVDNFIVLADDAGDHVLEHEFGHLAWAQHIETFPFALLKTKLERSTSIPNRHKLKSYARAYKCANAGTIMSYEERVLPVYSDPAVRYRGEVCGNALNANNAEVLREFVSYKLEQSGHASSENSPGLNLKEHAFD